MFYLLLFFGVVFCNLDDLQGWNYINIHCRDNSNAPVDWWIIYKPPSGEGQHWESGRNFTFLTPETAGKWQPSYQYITSNSMLQYTLSPLFRPTYQEHHASLVYRSREQTSAHFGSAASGVMIADEMGGAWIGHTVKGLVDLTRDRLYFPENELHNGHMMVCLSLNLDTLNTIAKTLKQVEPEVSSVRLPDPLKHLLREWRTVRSVDPAISKRKDMARIEYTTQGRSFPVSMTIRRPGDRRCIFKDFAQNKKLVLDAYGHGSQNTYCKDSYSVRTIDQISLKYAENIYYINNKTDRSCFAVSTTRHSHNLDQPSPKYWTCLSNVENDDLSGKGGLILCIEDYYVWRSFDILKVTEPKCLHLGSIKSIKI